LVKIFLKSKQDLISQLYLKKKIFCKTNETRNFEFIFHYPNKNCKLI